MRRCCNALSSRNSPLRLTAPSKLTCYSVAFFFKFYSLKLQSLIILSFPTRLFQPVFLNTGWEMLSTAVSSGLRGPVRVLPPVARFLLQLALLTSRSPLKSHMQFSFQAFGLGVLAEPELKEWHFLGPELLYFPPSTFLYFSLT